MARPDLPWREHFLFARAASAHAIQHLGNEASLPTLADISETQQRFGERKLALRRQNRHRRQLFLLTPELHRSTALPGRHFYCEHCALIEGVLASFPDLGNDGSK